MKKLYTLAAAALAAFALSACGGDDNSSGSENESVVKEVNKIGDLGSCTKNKFGEIVYVAETDSLYECGGKGWVATDSSAIDSLLTQSSSSEEEDDGSSDSKSSSSMKVDSTDVVDVETVKVDSVTLTGFAQKGPFASGTAVTVYGLDSALETTKTKFTGKVSGDSGAFKVEKIALPSQFALVQVSGFYTSENTGKKTSGTKTTLNAIVDLSEGKDVSANVNLFTELEYARVKYLVTKEKFNVPAAKKRATKELLESFGAKASDISATSISLDTTDAGSALLIASVLLQGDLSASKFGTRLADMAENFAENGSLSDADLRAELADWASRVDSTDNFAAIRANIKNLKLLASVPDFESFIYTFWTMEYRLGLCTDSLEETVKKNENKKSDNYGMGYACTSKHWHKSTALDTDLGLCTAKKEGSFEERKQEKKDTEYYVCRAGTWQKITETQFELKECTEERELEYVQTKSDDYFVCSKKQWEKIDANAYELKNCSNDRNNEYAKTKSGDFFVCIDGTWKEIDSVSYELKLCTTERENTYLKSESGEYFVCSEEKWKETDSLSYILNTLCTEDNNEKFTKSEQYGNFVCLWSSNKGGVWREANEMELDMDGVCGGKTFDANTIYKSNTGRFYLCSGAEWKASDKESYELQNIGKCTKERQYEVKATESLGDYACEWNGSEGAWRKASALESRFGVCKVARNDSVIVGSSSEKCYACINSEWKGVDNLACTVGVICQASLDSTFKDGYTCVHTSADGYYWRKQTTGEKATGKICKASLIYTFNNGYACDSVSGALNWRVQTEAEKKTGKVCRSSIAYELNNGYACDNSSGLYQWRTQTTAEKATGEVCRSYMWKRINNGYVCDTSSGSYQWRAETAEEKATGLVCIPGRDSVLTNGYVCVKDPSTAEYYWRAAKAGERATGLVCRSLYSQNVNSGYVCNPDDNEWRVAHSTEVLLEMSCPSLAKTYILSSSKDIYRCKTESEISNHAWTKLTSTYTDTRSDAGVVEKNVVYRYVTLGDSSFMIDNLRYRHNSDSLTCWRTYNNWAGYSPKHGVLYTWNCAMGWASNIFSSLASNIKQQGACPSGWHIPNADETAWMAEQMTELKTVIPIDTGYFDSGASLQDQYPKSTGYWTARLYDNSRAYVIGKFSGSSIYSLEYSGEGTPKSITDGYYVRCFKD